MSRQVVRAFGPRDRLEAAPESCDDAEGEVLVVLLGDHRYRPGDPKPPPFRKEISVRGRAAEEKLAALRCRWWGWARGYDFNVGPLTPLGHRVLADWLRAKEATGDAVAAGHRRELFPDAEDLAREAAAAEERRRREDLDHRRFLLRHNYSHQVRATQQRLDTIEARMLAIAYEIAAGANDLAHLQIELRRWRDEADLCRARIGQLQAAREGVAALPDETIPSSRALASGQIPQLPADDEVQPATAAGSP